MLTIDRLQLGYGKAPVLHQLSLQVPEGQFASLVGPSGCGKSSVLRAVVGLHEPDAGSTDLDVDHRDVGFLFQDDALLPWRSARDNVALGLRNQGRSRREARAEADRWLASVGLRGFEQRYPRELSGGQRKRVAIAQVLALRPRLLLMDEPFASLDAIVQHYLFEDLLRWVEGERLTVLLVTHDLEEAVALSDRVVLLGNGPRAKVKARFDVPLPRPRDLVRAKEHKEFVPLVRRLWGALSEEVEAPGGQRRQRLRVVNQ